MWHVWTRSVYGEAAGRAWTAGGRQAAVNMTVSFRFHKMRGIV